MKSISTFVSLFNNGFSLQDFPGLAGVAARPRNCVSSRSRGSRTPVRPVRRRVYGARDFLLSGRGHFALVIGVEKMTATPGKEVGDILLKASYQKEEADIPAGFAGVFGRIAEKYFQRYGDQSDALAAIAAKNHRERRGKPVRADAQGLGMSSAEPSARKTPMSRRR